MTRSYLVECIELWSRTQSLGVLAEQYLRRCSRINYYNWNAAQLYLINSTICSSPLSIFLGGILSNLPEVSYQGKAFRSSKTKDTSLISDYFIDNNIEDRDRKDCHGERLQRVLDGCDLSRVEEIANSHLPQKGVLSRTKSMESLSCLRRPSSSIIDNKFTVSPGRNNLSSPGSGECGACGGAMGRAEGPELSRNNSAHETKWTSSLVSLLAGESLPQTCNDYIQSCRIKE